MGILDDNGGGDVLFPPSPQGGEVAVTTAPSPSPPLGGGLRRLVPRPIRRSTNLALGHTRHILGHSPLASGAFLAVLILAVITSHTSSSSALARSVDTSNSAANTVCTSDEGLKSTATEVKDESESFKLSVAETAAVPTNDDVGEEDVRVDSSGESVSSSSSPRSVEDDLVEGDDATMEVEVEGEEDDDDVAKLTFGASRPGDGSDTDPDNIPSRFLRMQKGNRDKAIKAFQHTVQWRSEHDVDTILARPHPKFDRVKTIFPHYFAGRDASGNPILVQRFGSIDLDFAELNDVTEDEIRMHYVYVMEYCWNVWEPKSEDGVEGVMTSVLDMDGVSWRMLQRPHVMGFVRSVVSMTSAHYPQRSYKTLVINAPRWFHGVYRLIKPLLRESTKAKVSIYSTGKAQDEALREILGEGGLPRELLSDYDGGGGKEGGADGGADGSDGGKSEGEEGGTGATLYVSAASEPGPNSEIEVELRAFCLERLRRSGMEMLPVIRS